MAVRRSLAKELDTPGERRRSLRLASQKVTRFRACHNRLARLATSTVLATPRSLLRKVLQTQPIVSPLVPEKPDSPTSEKIELTSGIAPHSSLELSLSDPAPREKSQTTNLKTRTKKKVRLSEFERVLNKQLTSNTASSLLGNTSPSRSLQISLVTPKPLEQVGRRGLIRRPNNYRGVNVKAFEGLIEQNLLQIKGSQCHLVNMQATTLLSNDTEADLTETELFAQSQQSGQGGAELSVFHSRSTSIRQSSQRQQSMLPFIQTLPQGAKFGMDVNGVTRTDQKENLAGCADGTEAVPEDTAASSREEQQEGMQDAEDGLQCSNLKEIPSTEDAGGMDTVSPSCQQPPAGTPEREKQESLHENIDLEPFVSSGEYLVSGIGTAMTSTPSGIKFSQTQPGNLSSLRKKTAKRTVKEMVTLVLKELDNSVASATVDQDGSEANLEEELPPYKRAMQISQRTEAGTPSRFVSRRNTEQAGTPSRFVSRRDTEQSRSPPTKKMVDEQAGYCGEMREAENDAVSNAEIDAEAAELSEIETESENDEPTATTPTFVHARAFQCSPLLSTPRTPKVSTSKSSLKQPLIKRVPKQTERVPREKREPSLPSSLVKKIFSHYAGMPVSKDAFKAVEKCVNLYFKHLCEDLEAYTNHAGRKTTEPADLELLMRRQRLITDKMPLNVLIERHLPLEYRKLLIPVATSGNKVVPLKLR